MDIEQKEIEEKLINFKKQKLDKFDNEMFIEFFTNIQYYSCIEAAAKQYLDDEDSLYQDILNGDIQYNNSEKFINLYGFKISSLSIYERLNSNAWYRFQLLDYPEYFIEFEGYYNSWSGSDFSESISNIVKKVPVLKYEYQGLEW